MADRTKTGFQELLDGVKHVTFTDFPDFPNVGDTAIALGSMNYFESAGIEVLDVYSIATLKRRVFDSTEPVYINGGGSIGLYPASDRNRYRIAQNLNKGTKLIQGPQTVHFATEANRAKFVQRFGAREYVKIAAREEPSNHLLQELELRAEIVLMPDAAHMLGAIPSPLPDRQTLFLTRSDDEAADRKSMGTLDWPKDDVLTRIGCWRRQNPALSRVMNPSKSRWIEIAHHRLDRGVKVLSAGETIVTDRLHAMLISLQMGRSVIAIDNNNQKLSKYANTWFGTTSPDVRFAKSFDDARQILR
jgi:exopolysaccharide biosynthesis predicted pyruvyltransferase EpsI